jgi:hypothetical protein
MIPLSECRGFGEHCNARKIHFAEKYQTTADYLREING